MEFTTEGMKKKILFVGLNTVDLQFIVNEYPKPNTKTKALQNEICIGGPATNAAISCAFLGTEADLLTPVGVHIFSDVITKEIRNYNIRLIDPLRRKSSKPTFSSIITSKTNGDRTIFSYHPDIEYLKMIQFKFNLKCYQLALFDGFYADMSISIAMRLKKNEVITIFDGGSWKEGTDELLKYIDIVICSNDFQVPGGKTPEDIFAFLHAFGVKDIAITRGNNNILCSHKDGKEEIEIEQIDVADTLGAGDIFHGAFCHFYFNGYNFANSLQRASIVAGESCKWFGTREWMKNYIRNE